MSPRISTFMYAEGAGPVQDSSGVMKLQIINPLQAIIQKYIPTQYTFSVVFGIIELDTTTPHSLSVIFKNSVGNRVLFQSQDSQLPVEGNPNIPLSAQGLMIAMGLLNINFEAPGTYVTEILVDQVSLGKYSIEVIKEEGRE